jgi:hypothetical protein
MTEDTMSFYQETGTAEGPLPCTRTEAQILRDRPEWQYLTAGGPVRPPTEAEQAEYDARRASADWADLYGAVSGAQEAPEAAGVTG